MVSRHPLFAAIVGIDGCGKSSVFAGALEQLRVSLRVAGVGDAVLSGSPGVPLHERRDVPASRSARVIGGVAKGLRRPGLYKNVKFLDLTERSHIRAWLARHEPLDVILGDGDPAVNAGAWAAAKYYRAELSGDDAQLYQALLYLTGDQRIPPRRLPFYLRRAWQLALLNRLRLGRFTFPDLIFLLEIDPAAAMGRIRSRGRPLQPHETEAFLGELARAYERVCTLLQQRRGIPVVRLRVDRLSLAETVQAVVRSVKEQAMDMQLRQIASTTDPDRIDVIATTMSGSLQDQRKVGRIGPEFRARTRRPVNVHPADTHDEARDITHELVSGGARTIVSAGGAGTFNAVLEGAHVDGVVPPDVRLAFLRKGSADLIGKVLQIPDNLPGAVQAIVGGIESGRDIDADVLAIETTEPDGTRQLRHLIGFGGFGAFGEVPRFTESRVIKYYKGVLGTLFGDLGPFFVGLLCATVSWNLQRLLRRVSPTTLVLDDERIGPDTWGAVVVMNGDLGRDFPLGRGLDLASGTFRVVVLRAGSPRRMARQVVGCKKGTILDAPEQYGALAREVRALEVHPARRARPYLVNVDGLRMRTAGAVRVSVSGRVRLVAGAPQYAGEPLPVESPAGRTSELVASTA
jgi:diacylglycerol kinase family enzyme/thymidylate kinase